MFSLAVNLSGPSPGGVTSGLTLAVWSTADDLSGQADSSNAPSFTLSGGSTVTRRLAAKAGLGLPLLTSNLTGCLSLLASSGVLALIEIDARKSFCALLS